MDFRRCMQVGETREGLDTVTLVTPGFQGQINSDVCVELQTSKIRIR
jgi:hypothetical protein